MIKIKGRQNYLVALESVAMTDIVLNMFIFFFISFSLIYTFSPTKVSKIEVNLPKAPSAVALTGSEKAVLAITAKGRYFIDEEPVEGRALRAELGRRMAARPDLGLLLKVDGAAEFKSVAAALDAINELGISRVSVAAVKDGKVED
jgi:biopolymer transport protein ExbD